jgi:arsenate reductase-like glutaredoxin family protein
MAKATLFLKSTCTTCRDTKALIQTIVGDGGAEVAFRDYAKKPLERAEVEQIVALAGGSAKVLNTRHAAAKERGWKDTPPAAEAFIAAVLDEPNLLRRPILVKGKQIVVGKDEAAIRTLLA